ncbi:SRPBCC family protein [Muriicola sp.]|uniref:SRPBCC family protein n=1 Tax=Muriicola sp. TaxID=2020856 RepID=UPI003C741E29
MKYITEIVIHLPLSEFIKKLNNPDNLKHWQKDLISYRHLSGNPGVEGSRMELIYKMGKREVVLIETILTRNLPHELHVTYDAKGVHNIQHNYFKAIGEDSSKWISESEFRFNGFFMKLMAFMMPGIFKKQSVKYLKDFKAFAEDKRSES